MFNFLKDKRKISVLLNIGIISLMAFGILFLAGDATSLLRQKSSFNQNKIFSIQSNKDKVAYQNLLKKIETDNLDPNQIQYLPAPTIISITSPSKQFFLGQSYTPMFSPDEKLSIDGLAAPKSLVTIFFEPRSLAFSALAGNEGAFSISISNNILKEGTYQLFTEGKINQSSSGKVRRVDVVIKKPMDKNFVLFYGSLGVLLFFMIVTKVFLGGSVRVAKA